MTFRKAILFLIVFGSGAVVLALEIMAGRFLAPNFGMTVAVWGNLIAVFLAGLSIGYYTGGWISDRGASFWTFGIILLLSALLVVTLPLYAEPLRDWISGLGFREDMDPEQFERAMQRVATVGSLLASLAIFLLPTIFLGMVSPYAVKLLADDPAKLGRQVGSLYALSTLGSIVGALGTTFFMIDRYGTIEGIYRLGALQMALAVLAFVVAMAQRKPAPPET